MGSGQLIWGIAALPVAVVSRRLGPERSLLVAMVLVCGSYAFMVMVEALTESIRLAWLLFWNTIGGLGTSLFQVSSVPYLAGITSEKERERTWVSPERYDVEMAFDEAAEHKLINDRRTERAEYLLK